jgi:hypothetical protein
LEVNGHNGRREKGKFEISKSGKEEGSEFVRKSYQVDDWGLFDERRRRPPVNINMHESGHRGELFLIEFEALEMRQELTLLQGIIRAGGGCPM